nr:D-arabinono-1,4-lactone oxidase [Sediminibacterium sp.]
VLGSGHCFNTIADSAVCQVSLRNMNRVLEIHEADQTVTVEGGIRYGELAAALAQKGWALANLASLPHLSIAGAIATGTHGSGLQNQQLSSAVTGIELLRYDGALMQINEQENAGLLRAVRVHLGALGVLTRIKLRIEPAFAVKQSVWLLPVLDRVKQDLVSVFSSGYSVSVFTDWQAGDANTVWVKSRMDQPHSGEIIASIPGARPAPENRHPLPGLSAENCTTQMGIPGPWQERLPHFKMGFTPSNGEELQSEYFIPIEKGNAAIAAIERIAKQIRPLLYISELRTIAADQNWLSPCYQRDCLAIHFTWKPLQQEVSGILPLIESVLAPFYPRPHWGKLFTLSPQILAETYPQLDNFKALMQELDPAGKFRNAWIHQYLIKNKR